MFWMLVMCIKKFTMLLKNVCMMKGLSKALHTKNHMV